MGSTLLEARYAAVLAGGDVATQTRTRPGPARVLLLSGAAW